MRTYPFLIVSALLLATPVSARDVSFSSVPLPEITTTQRVSAQAEQKDDISPHRGSGRRDFSLPIFGDDDSVAWSL